MREVPGMSDNPSNPIPPSARNYLREPDGVKNIPADSSITEIDDQELLRRIRLSDQDAMGVLFKRYGGAVFSVALRILRDPSQAEDITQEILFQLWRSSESFVHGRGSLGAWLVVVARNRSIDALRRRKPTDSVEDVILASPQNLASEAERDVMIEKVRSYMASLPPEQQKSIELAFFQGMSHTEIATKTGDPLGTVKTRIRLALLSLRKALEA
jgi:RNA polymerase sigma-70 factor (ECF subfamily)